MDFKDMAYILAIGKYGNITKAAESLYLSQPTLSKFLKALEKSIGQPLFKKLGNKYVPTYAGERYMERAREILDIKKGLDQELGDIIKKNEGVLKIGFPAMRGTYMLPCTLPIFHKKYPRVHIELHEAKSSDLTKLILDGDIDLAFYNYAEREENISYLTISHEEMVLVMGKGSPFAHLATPCAGCIYPHIELKSLLDADFILQVPGQRTRQIMDQLFRRAGFKPHIVLETSNIQAEAELAARNYGLTFITETHLRHMTILDQLQLFSVGSPKTTVDFVAAYRTNSYVPEYARDFVEIVKEFT